MTAFAGALDLLFADPNLAHEAWHRDSEGQFTRIRIIPRRSDDVTTFGAARLVSCRTSTTLSARDNHLGRFSGR
jgi:hypothetical protein